MKNKKIITIVTAVVVLILLTVTNAGALKTNFAVEKQPMQNFHGVWGYVDQLPVPYGCVDGNMLPSICPGGGVGDTDFRLVCVVDDACVFVRLTAEAGDNVFSGRARVNGELLFFNGVYSVCNGFWVFSWMYEDSSFYLFGSGI